MTGQNATTGHSKIFDDGEAIARYAADWLLEAARARPDQPFIIALAGGSTPKRLYELMAKSSYAKEFPWSRTHLFFGDERFVPSDDPASNYAMVNHALLSHIEIDPANVHRMPTEGEPDHAAAVYARELRAIYGEDTLRADKPLFDVVLLGLGDNGHTASLFPRQPVLEEHEKWVSTCVPDDAPHTRLTLTFPAIESSRHVVFLVTGAGKKDALARVRAGDPAEPASHITTNGELLWLLDGPAAGL